MRNRQVWRRVSKRWPCSICGRPDWCLYAGPNGDPTAAICPRVESGKRAGEAGWLHRLRDDGLWRPAARSVTIAQDEPALDFGDFARRCAANVKSDGVTALADRLAVSGCSLASFDWLVAPPPCVDISHERREGQRGGDSPPAMRRPEAGR